MHVALLCALFAMNAAPAREDQFTRLGRERSQFGDKPNSGKWKHVATSHFGGTWILFPVGRSDRRYYFTESGGGSGPARLCSESKRGKRITLDWMIHFTPSPNPPPFPKPGSLGKYVCEFFHYYQLQGRIPAAARAALEATEALAGYRLTGGPGAPYFWFVYPDGKETKAETNWSLADGDYYILPKTREPYPITKEERQAILAMKAPRG